MSLGTGAQGGQYSILGFARNIPGTGQALNHMRLRDDPLHH
ncbi:hypothetical protein [Mycobacterium lepromatosis]|nr:hypothetical protein [Mycobacterium lepromatosis]